MEPRLLQVGDVLYNESCDGKYRDSPTHKITIGRVTPTQAIAGSVRVKREPYNGNTGYGRIGERGFFYLANETSEAKFQANKARIIAENKHEQDIRLLHHTAWRKLDRAKFDRILAILNEPEP
jgi:hypothetical protein